MLIRRFAIQNVRSFLDRTELLLDGNITIVIGPNGGGKTNLLDTTVIMLRRYLFASMYAVHAPTPEQFNRYQFQYNDALNSMVLERHSDGNDMDQIVEVEVEVTSKDIQNMQSIKADVNKLLSLANKKYSNLEKLGFANQWQLENIHEGMRLVYRILNGTLQLQDIEGAWNIFYQYLQMFEIDGMLREEFEFAPLATPLVYLPVNRAASGFKSSVELAAYDEFEIKRQSDAAISRTSTSIVNLAVGRLAQRYRLLLEKDQGLALKEFRNDANTRELTSLLSELGYEWSLETVNALKNQYDIRLQKQGSYFFVNAASSGERELLTYLFAIFALNVRDALIIVDEPELHLHPKWQKILMQLFIRLTQSTSNQFLLATHASTFVSPESIHYVSRVFSQKQRSQILRLDTTVLPEGRHLLSIVNSQNNERLFFADKVILVEGLSDRIFFEALLDHFGRSSSKSILEVISVGGKGLFEAYKKILEACKINYSIVADLDYIEQVGTEEIKNLFKINTREIKTDVIENIKSFDGDTLVQAIDNAMKSKSWDHAEQIWEYIKSRRRHLRNDLSEHDKRLLQLFIKSKQMEQIYILSRGSLEAYLPSGHNSKELDKLISLLTQENFYDQLPNHGKTELQSIVNCLLKN